MDVIASVQRQPTTVIYPESDGKPMADNTKQLRYIMLIVGCLMALFKQRKDVFVGGNLFWYPVQGNNTLRIAPDALVVFGRPPGDRGSYLQWLEEGIPMHVVFEVLSPGNTRAEMLGKLQFYDQYGVEEYYEYDPDRGVLKGWLRQGNQLHAIAQMQGWVSPLLGVRFELSGSDLNLFYPDGRKFEHYVELDTRAEQEHRRAAAEAARAAAEMQRADLANRHAAEADQRAEAEAARAERLTAQLRALGAQPEV